MRTLYEKAVKRQKILPEIGREFFILFLSSFFRIFSPYVRIYERISSEASYGNREAK
jgi:hypothetical protein